MAALFLATGLAQPATSGTPAGEGTELHGADQRRERAAVLISFIDSPTATCYHSAEANDICHVNWEQLSVTASASQYIIRMTVEIDGRLRAVHHGFFQDSMTVQAEMFGDGFEVACGDAGAGGDPDFGNSYPFIIRAEETGGLSATNFGTVFCPARLTTPVTPAIEMTKTVGTDPAVCAATDEITVPAGTTVYYCFTVTNTGDATLDLHDLADDQLGSIFNAFSYDLEPGDSTDTVALGLSISAVITVDTTNTATWTAYNAGPVNQASAQASATVYALPEVLVTVVVGTPGGGTVTGGGPYTVGDMATVEAFPSAGWVFLHWLVDGSEITDNPYTFEVTGDATLTAIFQRQIAEPIPTTGTVALVLLLGLLVGVGVFLLRRVA